MIEGIDIYQVIPYSYGIDHSPLATYPNTVKVIQVLLNVLIASTTALTLSSCVNSTPKSPNLDNSTSSKPVETLDLGDQCRNKADVFVAKVSADRSIFTAAEGDDGDAPDSLLIIAHFSKLNSCLRGFDADPYKVGIDPIHTSSDIVTKYSIGLEHNHDGIYEKTGKAEELHQAITEADDLAKATELAAKQNADIIATASVDPNFGCYNKPSGCP